MVDDMRTQIEYEHWYVGNKIQKRTVGGNKNDFNYVLHKNSENPVVWALCTWK